jgi:hypothetical protein
VAICASETSLRTWRGHSCLQRRHSCRRRIVGHASACPVERNLSRRRNFSGFVSSGIETAKPEKFVAYREGGRNGHLSDLAIRAAGNLACRRPFRPPFPIRDEFLRLRCMMPAKQEAEEIPAKWSVRRRPEGRLWSSAIYRMKSKTQVGQAFSLRRASARLLGTRRISPASCPSSVARRSPRNS